ncbi:MAG TPA: dihydrolipoamide acetyltransferase [Myxococcaceae bacterium]|nr:dihydrolipoamide acetyltransferase [Myxococcaceae bacterium]
MKLARAALCALAMVPFVPHVALAQQTTTEVQKPGEAPAPQKPLTADEAFNARVKTLEEQVVDLKEKIFRTKARLLLLQETVLGGDLSSGARAVLFHRNEMGSSFVLESVAYALDGAPIFTKVDVNGDLDKREEFEIFNGRIVPGQHQIAVRLVYRGHGYGIFSYLEGYKFKVQSSYTFNAEAAKVTTVKIVGYEKGGITADLKDRPAVRYDVEVAKDAAMKPQDATPAAPDQKGAAPATPAPAPAPAPPNAAGPAPAPAPAATKP